MSIETAVVVGLDGEPLYWHLPAGRNAVHLPDSRDLFWDGLWANMDNLSGLAHSHPGSGRPVPSYTDVTTFHACEQALGRLTWWICTEDQVRAFRWVGPGKYDYGVHPEPDRRMTEKWLAQLRELSYNTSTSEGGTP